MSRVDEYVSKGFDRRTAEYFAGGRKKVVSVTPHENLTLSLTFDSGERRIFNMKHIVEDGTVFAFLSEPSNFMRVYIDEDGSVCWDIDPDVDSSVVWNNKVDLSPDTCYLDSELLDVDR